MGILVRSPLTSPWPCVVTSLLSISSKYALRRRGRHLWNPSNFGVSVVFFLVPAAAVSLSLEWGNYLWAPLIILCLGALILYTLGRLHITLTYAAAFTALSLLRSALTHRPVLSELGLLTAPSYLLFMFFMITDPKTTTRTWPRQCAVVLAAAIVETVLRLGDSHSRPLLRPVHRGPDHQSARDLVGWPARLQRANPLAAPSAKLCAQNSLQVELIC